MLHHILMTWFIVLLTILSSCSMVSMSLVASRHVEFSSWTFGSEQNSSRAFFIVNETHGDNFTVSFLLRSLQPGGVLLQMLRRQSVYLTVYLREGALALHSPPHTTLLSEDGSVADGTWRLVTLELRYGNLVYPKAGNHRALGEVSLQAGDVVVLGGGLVSVNQHAAPPSWGGHFTGCLQDVRLDHKRLEIGSEPSDEVYPAEDYVHVLQGCHSDDTCKVTLAHYSCILHQW